MNKSDSTAALAAALGKAQSAIVGAVKDSTNPFYNSRYADLASVWDACRGPLTQNGLAIVQTPATEFGTDARWETVTARNGEKRNVLVVMTHVSVTTTLLHTSGEWCSGTVAAMLPNGDPQAVGSAITYLRRYGLSAMIGIPQIDDDANATVAPTTETRKATPEQLPAVQPASLLTLTPVQVERLKALMKTHAVKAAAVKARIEAATVYATGGTRQPYPIKTAADIRQVDYDDICAWVIAGGR